MKYIQKNNEPAFLNKYKIGANPTYAGYNDKVPNSNPIQNPIRDSLLEEQGHICAYCMNRISLKYDDKLNKPKIEIEHYRSQKRFPKLDLDYKNMLGVCNGNSGQAQHLLTCDKAKSKYDVKGEKGHDLFVDPLVKNRIAQIEYTFEGEIFSEEERIDYDLNEILNLNEPELIKRRRNVYRKVKKEIRFYQDKVKGNPAKMKVFLRKEKTKWEILKDNKLIPFGQVALYVIQMKLLRYS